MLGLETLQFEMDIARMRKQSSLATLLAAAQVELCNQHLPMRTLTALPQCSFETSRLLLEVQIPDQHLETRAL
jgi:hypothetical protein